MARIQRMREVLTGPLSPAYVERKSGEGWTPVAIVWERQVSEAETEAADISDQVPYGLKISEDCLALEQDLQEKDALLAMLEMIIQDKPLSEIAESLNQRGFRTRHNHTWTPGLVFDLLPRLIEVGPRVFSSSEWVVRRGRLMNAI